MIDSTDSGNTDFDRCCFWDVGVNRSNRSYLAGTDGKYIGISNIDRLIGIRRLHTSNTFVCMQVHVTCLRAAVADAPVPELLAVPRKTQKGYSRYAACRYVSLSPFFLASLIIPCDFRAFPLLLLSFLSLVGLVIISHVIGHAMIRLPEA